MGIRVVAFGTDEAHLNALYRDAARVGLPITPLIMDFCKPSPACVSVGDGYTEYHPPAEERLRCELVLAMGVGPHLGSQKDLAFGDVISRMSPFSTKWLLVEVAAGDDRFKGECSSDQHGCHSMQSFIGEMRKVFSHVEVLESYPARSAAGDASPGQGEASISQKLLFCER